MSGSLRVRCAGLLAYVGCYATLATSIIATPVTTGSDVYAIMALGAAWA